MKYIHPNTLPTMDCGFLMKLKEELDQVQSMDALSHVAVYGTVHSDGTVSEYHIDQCGRDEATERNNKSVDPYVWVRQYLEMMKTRRCKAA